MVERLNSAQITAIVIVALLCIPVTTCMSSDSDGKAFKACIDAGKNWVSVPLLKDGFGNPAYECK